MILSKMFLMRQILDNLFNLGVFAKYVMQKSKIIMNGVDLWFKYYFFGLYFLFVIL